MVPGILGLKGTATRKVIRRGRRRDGYKAPVRKVAYFIRALDIPLALRP